MMDRVLGAYLTQLAPLLASPPPNLPSGLSTRFMRSAEIVGTSGGVTIRSRMVPSHNRHYGAGISGLLGVASQAAPGLPKLALGTASAVFGAVSATANALNEITKNSWKQAVDATQAAISIYAAESAAQRLDTALQAGTFLSSLGGYYVDGTYGKLENLAVNLATEAENKVILVANAFGELVGSVNISNTLGQFSALSGVDLNSDYFDQFSTLSDPTMPIVTTEHRSSNRVP